MKHLASKCVAQPKPDEAISLAFLRDGERRGELELVVVVNDAPHVRRLTRTEQVNMLQKLADALRH